MDAPLLLDDRCLRGRWGFTLASLATAIAIAAVTATAVTASAPMLFTFALRTITPRLLLALMWRGLSLLLRGLAFWTRLRAFASERMELRRFA